MTKSYHTWYRAVVDPAYTKAGRKGEIRTGPRYLSESQARADGKRKVEKHDLDEHVVMEESEIPEDPSEVFDDE